MPTTVNRLTDPRIPPLSPSWGCVVAFAVADGVGDAVGVADGAVVVVEGEAGVGVAVGVTMVGVAVPVDVGVDVAVGVRVCVGVDVDVRVGVAVDETVVVDCGNVDGSTGVPLTETSTGPPETFSAVIRPRNVKLSTPFSAVEPVAVVPSTESGCSAPVRSAPGPASMLPLTEIV